MTAGMTAWRVPGPSRAVPQTLAASRVADLVLDRIASGQYAGRLPVKDTLAAEAGVSATTVGRALRYLSGRGVIYLGAGRRYQVRPQAATEARHGA